MKEIWRKAIEQAVDEYIEYKYSRSPKERAMFYNARDFLFDDHYKICFGEKEATLAELLDLFGIDIEWFRLGVRRKEEEINTEGDYQPGTQLPLF
jgi:hypothetical protein